MDIFKVTKGMFAVKDVTPGPENPVDDKKGTVSYQEYGFYQAFSLGGSISGLRVCLQKIYFYIKDQIKDDHEKQEELKKPLRIKLEEHNGEINLCENKIKRIHDEEIPRLKQKIDGLKEEISFVRNNPQEIVGDQVGKPSFYIGVTILSFLTVYLFVFYSSASYSTFFKQFTLSSIGIADSIFDAQALPNALKDGILELILILTIPFVFLGLGYLIHKFQEGKGFSRVIKTVFLILITFIFDAILAYHITEKIYEINSNIKFVPLPEYSIPIAIKSINFWLIIFAGFLVYIIWGLVLDFVLDAFSKIDRIKVALKEKDKQIEDAKSLINQLNADSDKLSQSIDETKAKIKVVMRILDDESISQGYEQYMYSFIAGWLAWMRGNGKPEYESEIAESTAREFMAAIDNYSKINN